MNQNLAILPDEALVAEYAAGKNEAFDCLLKRHEKRVFSFIYSYVRDNDIADDIFQETFVKAITTIKQGRYNESGRFGAWLSRIAYNLIIDHFRQIKSDNTVSSDTTDGLLFNRKELSEGTVEDSIIASQIQDDVRRLVDALPESQKEVLEMRYYQNMSFKEIADATGVSINTALGRMRYAILNMRRMAETNGIVLSA
ncbi:MAG: sigma-70 family RNA polymerase sigma factor [Bacteroidales bacterium]|nr:sigma-70 family RNA polymerase sigma factor [Bacteroidales bacterium]MBD5241027.1 sigma-70 family RNA polymerase sigma factor [Barnesiella sp.]MDE5821197.1 sigma-70 family RNA polymerase sigma factor [Paramuribaculum sp.]